MGIAPGADPTIFLKPPSSVIGPGDPIVLTHSSRRVDYEGELAVVIGRTASKLPDGCRSEALHPRLHLLERCHRA